MRSAELFREEFALSDKSLAGSLHPWLPHAAIALSRCSHGPCCSGQGITGIERSPGSTDSSGLGWWRQGAPQHPTSQLLINPGHCFRSPPSWSCHQLQAGPRSQDGELHAPRSSACINLKLNAPKSLSLSGWRRVLGSWTNFGEPISSARRSAPCTPTPAAILPSCPGCPLAPSHSLSIP